MLLVAVVCFTHAIKVKAVKSNIITKITKISVIFSRDMFLQMTSFTNFNNIKLVLLTGAVVIAELLVVCF